MKKLHTGSSGLRLFSIANIVLVFLLLFTMLPNAIWAAEAQSDNATSPSSENKTLKIPPSSINVTIDTPQQNDIPDPVIPIFERVKKIVKPDEEARLASTDARITLKIPKGAVSERAEFSLQEKYHSGSTGTRMLRFFELNAQIVISAENGTPSETPTSDNSTPKIPTSDNSTNVMPPVSDNSSIKASTTSDNSTPEIPPASDNLTPRIPSVGSDQTSENLTLGKKITQFNKELQITIQHTAEELQGLDLDSLHLYYLDEDTRQWVPVPGAFNRETLVLTATLTHFTNYGEQANPLQNGPGRVMAAQVAMHSGTATFSYPIELPPGPGGFQPKVELTYNSGSADEMKNKRDVGSWVGIGWDLKLGSISCELTTNAYNLDLNGASYKLFSSDNVNYRTQPDEYLKITRTGNTKWEVWDKEGNYYKFGDTTDARQYVYETSRKYYRWDLSSIQDTNGNNAIINYVQNTIGSSPNDTIRSAYVDNVTYGNGNIVVKFYSSSNITDPTDGALRVDSPRSTGSNPAPKIMENRKLDAIQISFNGTTLRNYNFLYETTASTNSTDYSGGIFYAGKHTLKSITQADSDNTSSLPFMSFIYQDLQTYRHTTEGDYTGNPGNPASLYWPRLTRVYSGYGGTVDFSYTQIPNTTVNNIWTRQAVTTKTVNPTNAVSADWWNDSWSTRRKLTFNTTNVSANLTDFPVLVHLTTSNFDFNLASANGTDLRFIDSDNTTVLKHEIEKWVANTEAWVWVKVPKLDGNVTTDHIWIYYGNTSAQDGQDPANVWDSNYKLVSHMDNKPDNTHVSDSTSNDNDGTKTATDEPTGVMNIIGQSQHFDGNDRVNIGYDVGLQMTDGCSMSFEAMISTNQTSAGDLWANIAWSSMSSVGYCIMIGPNNLIRIEMQDGTTYYYGAYGTATGINNGSIRHIAIVRDGDNDCHLYMDGVELSKSTIGNLTTLGSCLVGRDITLGMDAAPSDAVKYYYTGYMDELRFSNTARSGTWIKASHLSQSGNLIGFGSKEDKPESPVMSEPSITTTYNYTDNPQYLGTGWDQKFRGWNGVTETDAAGNYIRHRFYTTGIAGSKDAETLSGKEYMTEWFDNQGKLLKNTTYDWSIKPTEFANGNKLTLKPDSSVVSQLTTQSARSDQANYESIDDNSIDYDTTYIYSDLWNQWEHDLYSLPNHTTENGTINSVMIFISHRRFDDNSEQNSLARGRTAIKTNSVEYLGTSVDPGTWYITSNTTYTVNPQTGSAWTWDEIDSLQVGFSGYSVWGDYGSWARCTQVWVEVNWVGTAIQLNQVTEYTYNTSGNLTSLILRPDENAIVQLSSYNGTNYTCVDEDGSSDGDSTYVTQSLCSNVWYRDLYGFFNHTTESGVISNVRVYIRHRIEEYLGGDALGRTVIKTNGVEYTGSAVGPGYTYSISATDYSINPQTGLTWTWEEIDSLQAGFSGYAYWDMECSSYPRCTQVWIDISYYPYAGSPTSRTRYEYDSCGNVVTEYLDGDISINTDNATIHKEYYSNNSTNILSKVARQWITDYQGNTRQESRYYYDNATLTTPPTKGNLTRIESSVNATSSVSSYFTYDDWGNRVTSTDASGNTTTWTYDATHHTYPATKTYPNSFSENYTYDIGTNNLLNMTDINGVTTNWTYDNFKRLVSVIKNGDTSDNASTVYVYDNWGTLDHQNITILTKTAPNSYLSQKDYFDGLGRVLQTHSYDASENVTYISSTVAFNNRGLVDKQYVSQNVTGPLTGYYSILSGWRYSTYTYDALGRVVAQTGADNTTVSHDYSTAWQDLVTSQLGHKKRYHNDAFGRLTKVEELTDNGTLYATTTYSYDVIGNLLKVTDAASNNTTMTYDWLSRKIGMNDPDMGGWSYGYDAIGNLISQTDAKSQTITMSYDNLNRLINKYYPAGSNMTDVSYFYDQGANGNGRRTFMSDASGNTTYTYDARGRLIEETKTIAGISGGSSNQTSFRQLIVGGYSDNLSKTTTEYNSLAGGYTWFNYQYSREQVASTNGTLSNLFVEFSEPPINGTYTITLMLGSNPTAISVNITGNNTQGCDIIHTINVQPGDLLSLRSTYSGSPTATPSARWSIRFTPVNANESLILGVSKGVSGETRYSPIMGGINDNPTAEYAAYQIIPTAGKIKNLYVKQAVDAGTNPDAYQFMLRVNTANTTLTCIIVADNLTGYDTEHEITVAPGDRVSLMITPLESPGTSSITCSFGFTFVADTPGESILMAQAWNSFTGTKYHSVVESTFTVPWSSTENATYQGGQSGFELKKLIFRLVDGTSSGNYTMDVRVNSADTGITATVPAGSYSASDNVNSFALSDYDRLDVELTAAGTARKVIWAMVVACPASSGNSTSQSANFTTRYAYDSADRLTSILYPTGENVTQSYNGRGLPYSLNGTQAGALVTGTLYNQFGMPTQINLGNGLKTTYAYWGIDHETASYGRLYEIQTLPQAGGSALQQVQPTWDNGGNLSNRYDALTSDTENFSYDFLDRLTGVSGNYTESFTYNAIGNIMSKNGRTYSYGSKPHAVTSITNPNTSYAYDDNGNMYQRGSDNITWDAENRPVSVSNNGTTTTFVYDGDGNRVMKIEGGQTVLYVSSLFEVNCTTSTNTSYYYLGGALIAMSVNSTIKYIHKDHLGGTSAVTSDNGTLIESIKYFAFGETRSITGPDVTDKLFTGQRLDDTGLYYYNARYYDPTIGRFISPDTIIPNPTKPQAFNRYSYCYNNPLRFIDPSGHLTEEQINYIRLCGMEPPPDDGTGGGDNGGGGSGGSNGGGGGSGGSDGGGGRRIAEEPIVIPFKVRVTATGSWYTLGSQEYPYSEFIDMIDYMAESPLSPFNHLGGALAWKKWSENHINRGIVADVIIEGKCIITNIPGMGRIIDINLTTKGNGIMLSDPIVTGRKNFNQSEKIKMQSRIYIDREIKPLTVQIDFKFQNQIGLHNVALSRNSLIIDIQNKRVLPQK